jgi:hypothetical protein
MTKAHNTQVAGIPRALDLLHLDAYDAARERWHWGETLDMPKLEDSNTDRNALMEAYEEMLDCINYLSFAAKSDTHQAEIRRMRNRMINEANQLRDICKGGK